MIEQMLKFIGKNQSQWQAFIVFSEAKRLPGHFTPFGEVLGWERL